MADSELPGIAISSATIAESFLACLEAFQPIINAWLYPHGTKSQIGWNFMGPLQFRLLQWGDAMGFGPLKDGECYELPELRYYHLPPNVELEIAMTLTEIRNSLTRAITTDDDGSGSGPPRTDRNYNIRRAISRLPSKNSLSKIPGLLDNLESLAKRQSEHVQPGLQHDMLQRFDPTSSVPTSMGTTSLDLGHPAVQPPEDIKPGTKLQSEVAPVTALGYRQRFLQGLWFPGMRHCEDGIHDALFGTCNSIFAEPKEQSSRSHFPTWLESDEQLYWVNGRPGSGKSILMKYLVHYYVCRDHLTKWARRSPLFIGRYFFCKQGHHLQKSEEGFLRSLLYDLLAVLDFWPSDLTELLEKWEFKARSETHLDTEQPLWHIFALAATEFCQSGKMCLFVDGLDELDGNHNHFVASLKGLLFENPGVKVCISSRQEREFQDAFGSSPSTQYEPDLHGDLHRQGIANRARQDNSQRLDKLMMKAEERWRKLTQAAGGDLKGGEIAELDSRCIEGRNDRDGEDDCDLFERHNHGYVPAMTVMTATASSAKSPDLWSLTHPENSIDVSTSPTSNDQGDCQRAVGEQLLTDYESIYSSNIPESSVYAHELATSFFAISGGLPDAKSLERVHRILSELLRGFALRIGAEKNDPNHFKVMKFIHGMREVIATQFKEYYLKDKEDVEELEPEIVEMSLNQRLEMWNVDSQTHDSRPDSPDHAPWTSPTEVGIDDTLPDFDEGSDLDDEENNDDLQLSLYRTIVTKSTAFQWLVGRVHRETNLAVSDATSMHAIATQIRRALYAQQQNRLISSRRGPPTCSMVFKSDWMPLEFVLEQEYAEAPDDAIQGAIVLVHGLNGDTEAMPCAEYLGRTWPLLGENFMELLRHVVRSKPGLRCFITLSDKTTISAWIEPSGCLTIKVSGVVETIVEVGEVYGFVTAALRSSAVEAVTITAPVLEITNTETSDKPTQGYFHQELWGSHLSSGGQCWRDLFRNPVVVTGYPVRRRQPGQAPGIEFSYDTLMSLLGARNLAFVGEKVFLKGFCTMLVATKNDDDTVHWHVLFNEDGSRISVTDPRVRDAVRDFELGKHLVPSSISSARHIVGWCEGARNYAGAKEANYDIGRTGLKKPSSRVTCDRVTISGGHFVTVGFSVALGKKDKPARTTKSSEYHRQLEWAERQFVVFYDWKNRRAWLVDGLSALLHLVRAHIAHRRMMDREVLFTDSLVKEANSPHTGKKAARQFLNNRANMDLQIYERWNRPVIESSTEQGADEKSTVKRQQTFEHMVDLVSDIFGILSLLFDIQSDASTADGYGARVRASPRRQLDGWDFFDVATFEETIEPKATSLSNTGLGWVDLVRSVSAITLFGVGFGELIQPGMDKTPGIKMTRTPEAVVQVFELEGDTPTLVTPSQVLSSTYNLPNQSGHAEA